MLAPGRRLTLLSAPGAALFAGCAWWRAMVARGQALAPGLIAADILDCADAPARALEALRLGQRMLVLDPGVTSFASVVAAADGVAVVLDRRPPALDMAAPAANRGLQAWLGSEDA
ncbi:MAG TPA: hypothetical protein VJY39_22780 [Acidisphaera sp.]|nr:hypothetical protein [Acidisphaera sp.]